jgi:RNA polymerase sigma factor (sigma-70 family)
VNAIKPLAMAGNPAPSGPSNQHGDDHAVVARLRQGDGAAFALLMDRHGARLHAMLLHLAHGDHDLAAEFTQEAFVRAFTNLDQFAGASSFYTWLYRLARNRALDLLARKKPLARDPATLGGEAASDVPGADLASAELRGEVRRALGELPLEQREILLLREFDGLDYAEIASALGIAEGTVKSRLNRARAALRDRLAGRVSAEDLA